MKCSSDRPICESCNKQGAECTWDTVDGLTKTEDLKRKLAETNEHLDHLETLIRVMRSGTDKASTMLLARLRLGASVESLAQSIRSDQGPWIFEDAVCFVPRFAKASQQH